MTTSPAATSTPDASKIASFFVVPVVPDNGSTESVHYYEEVPHEKLWKRVSAKDLNAGSQGCHSDKLKLSQPSLEQILHGTGLPNDKIDHGIQLYSAVARTMDADDGLPTLFALGHDDALTIPVNAKTTRGVILVFTKAPQTGLPPYPITDLIASTDPEIKNTTGG